MSKNSKFSLIALRGLDITAPSQDEVPQVLRNGAIALTSRLPATSCSVSMGFGLSEWTWDAAGAVSDSIDLVPANKASLLSALTVTLRHKEGKPFGLVATNFSPRIAHFPKALYRRSPDDPLVMNGVTLARPDATGAPTIDCFEGFEIDLSGSFVTASPGVVVELKPDSETLANFLPFVAGQKAADALAKASTTAPAALLDALVLASVAPLRDGRAQVRGRGPLDDRRLGPDDAPLRPFVRLQPLMRPMHELVRPAPVRVRATAHLQLPRDVRATTSVAGLAAATGAPRVEATVRGLRDELWQEVRLQPAATPRSSRTALRGLALRGVRRVDVGAKLQALTARLRQGGAPLAAGQMQVMDWPGRGIPLQRTRSLLADGDQAMRVYALDLALQVRGIFDVAPGRQRLELPGGTRRMVAIGAGVGGHASTPSLPRILAGFGASDSVVWIGSFTFLSADLALTVRSQPIGSLLPFEAVPVTRVLAGVRDAQAWLPAATGSLLLVFAADTPPNIQARVGGQPLAAPRVLQRPGRFAYLFPWSTNRAAALDLAWSSDARVVGLAVASEAPTAWEQRWRAAAEWTTTACVRRNDAGTTTIRFEEAL